MKHSIKIVLALFTIGSIYSSSLAQEVNDDHRDTVGKTFFHSRSESLNKAQESAGMANLITWGYDECSNGVFWVTAEIERSFDRHGIGKYLFFNGTDTMKTGTSNGPGIDIFAENFLLNDNFNGAITARPFVTNELLNLSFFCALDFCYPGLYFLAHIPYVNTQWTMDLRETVSTQGTIISANTLGNVAPAPAPFNSMIEAWNGQGTFFDVKEPLHFARIDGKKSKSHIADIELGLGYILLSNECNYFSINIRGIIPTGNRPTGEFVFEPIVGNTHHGQIGAGLLGNFYLWENGCQEFLSILLNANIYTILTSREKRTFDLKNNGIGSRYLLFKKFSGVDYAGEIVRGPNILTLDVDTKNRVEADVVLMVEYIRCNLLLDAGYNLWGRSRDHLKLIGSIPENSFGIAGLSGTAGINRNRTASSTLINGENATSIDPSPVFISNSDIDVESAAHPGAFSHGLFVHIGYIWNDIHYIQPFVGLGSEIEFSGTNRSFKMWHLWGKIGASF